jgi:hypothetical protein
VLANHPFPEPRVKGAVVREMLLWYEDRFGHDALARLLRRIPREQAQLLAPGAPAFGVLASTWYPSSLVNAILDVVCEETDDEGREIARMANAVVVPRMIHGVYRVLFTLVATPERYARHVPRLWRGLHTTGERTMKIRAPAEAFSATESWAGHHPTLCWVTIYTMAYVFEAMGYRTWDVDRIACVSHGARRCETVLRFQK